MADFVTRFYDERLYPAMSHPSADPAVNAVAARLVGLRPVNPSGAAILEIGCASGHHLLPLALRWPESRFTGIDSSRLAIEMARRRGEIAGAGNIGFAECPIGNFAPEEESFDYVIAHGFFSWVPDEEKETLMGFVARHLAHDGVAVVSFNVAAGWRKRLPVIVKTRAIMAAGECDISTALHVLRDVAETPDELTIIDDMLAKGGDILPFDDFAPVNDAWTVSDFVAFAERHGLRWLGDSVPGGSPRLSPDSEESPAAAYDRYDEAYGTPFRSVLLCRADADVRERIQTSIALEFSVRLADDSQVRTGEAGKIARVIRSSSPGFIPVAELVEAVPDMDIRRIFSEVLGGIAEGWITARVEPLRLHDIVPPFPSLSAWRMHCVRENLLVVDALHHPCAFTENQRAMLRLMDGTRSLEELAALAKAHYRGLDFESWMRAAAGRGIFS